MGKFGNKLEGMSGPIHGTNKLPWNGESGFEAMGREVPAFRRSAAANHMKDMGFTREGDAEKRFTVIERMSACIEREDTHEAMEFAIDNGVDATGCYRLLAVLLAAEPVA